MSKTELRASSDSLRTFMWKLTQEMTMETAAEHGSKFLEIPKNTYDQNFVLLQEYYAEDLTHTNEKFGERLLIEIDRYFRSINE